MTHTPQSIAAGYRQPVSPARRLGAWQAALAAVMVASAAAQAPGRQVSADADFTKEAAGTTVLASVLKGTLLTPGTSQASRTEVTLEGWLPKSALRDEKRDGYDVAVALAAGATLRSAAGDGTPVAIAKAGALFQRASTQGEWIQVRRKGWLASDRLVAPTATATATAPAKPPLPAPQSAESDVTLSGTAPFSAIKAGKSVGMVEAPLPGKVVARADGWVKVQLEVWVREESLGGSATTGLTAADLRADPDKYTGQEVQWTLQVLAVQKADELRPELPLNQPYVLARGPLPESGFVYLVIPAAEIDRFKALEPLAKITIAGTVRAGRSRHLPTPVIDFVRRIK